MVGEKWEKNSTAEETSHSLCSRSKTGAVNNLDSSSLTADARVLLLRAGDTERPDKIAAVISEGNRVVVFQRSWQLVSKIGDRLRQDVNTPHQEGMTNQTHLPG